MKDVRIIDYISLWVSMSDYYRYIVLGAESL